MVNAALQTVVSLSFSQFQNSKHSSFDHGVISLYTHTFQVSPGPAGGQVWTPQITGEKDTQTYLESWTCHVNLLCARYSDHVTHGRICLFFPQNVTLAQQMVESIKQEPMECAIEQPPLKKIKQEVLSTQYKHVHTCRQIWDLSFSFYFEKAKMKSGTHF